MDEIQQLRTRLFQAAPQLPPLPFPKRAARIARLIQDFCAEHPNVLSQIEREQMLELAERLAQRAYGGERGRAASA